MGIRPEYSQANSGDANLPEKAFLVVNGMVFPLDKPVVRIGRNLENDLVLNHPTVSRFHAEIQYKERQFILVDKNSSSGTYLNNRKITEYQLFAGDIILFAKVPVMFMNEGASLLGTADQRTGRLSDVSSLELTPTEEENEANSNKNRGGK
jgi:pSer/pThr/pTyr-binding forkhead associated (FHA) protein